MNEMPRRIQRDKWVKAEQMIQAAVDEVESLGADARLTGAVILLARAKDKVADFVDGVESI